MEEKTAPEYMEAIDPSLPGQLPPIMHTGAEPLRLLEAIMRFTAERNREALDAVLLQTMMEVLPAAAVQMYRRDYVDGAVRMVASLSQPVPEGTPARETNRALEQVLHDCIQKLSRLGPGEEGFRAIYASDYSLHPLYDADGLSGLMFIENIPGQSSDPGLVHGLLKIYRNFVSVIDDAHRDTLTGLLNRKTFETSIQAILREARAQAPAVNDRRHPKEGSSHWLAVMDIDHFKRINDTFGHLYGDEVLLLLSQLMQKSFRRTDRLFRFGGEEFAVLLGPCLPEDAFAVLDRFRQSVATHNFPQVGQVTISIGFVTIFDQDVPATVVGHADEALYASKHGGRNRVTCYSDLRPDEDAVEQQSGSIDLF